MGGTIPQSDASAPSTGRVSLVRFISWSRSPPPQWLLEFWTLGPLEFRLPGIQFPLEFEEGWGDGEDGLEQFACLRTQERQLHELLEAGIWAQPPQIVTFFVLAAHHPRRPRHRQNLRQRPLPLQGEQVP